MVTDELRLELNKYKYDTSELRLSAYLREHVPDIHCEGLPYDERLWEAMTAGDLLRTRWGRGDALALCAISDIVATRLYLAPALADGDRTIPVNLERHAFVLRSLKTQDELETLRAVYGSRFVLIAAFSPDDDCSEHLADEIARSRGTEDREQWLYQPEQLMKRDYKEEMAGGQDTSGTFHRADFFVRATSRQAARSDLSRVLELLFGHPFRTPRRDEYGQFQAAAAAMRSSEPGRQVGAAIVDEYGSVLALGSNEVPRFGGGAPWEEDGDGGREFEVARTETNRSHQEQLAQRLTEVVLGHVTPDLPAERADELRERLPAALRDGGIAELTEYGRAVHAEMHALLDAARRGVSVADAVLYTTTFPCHNCTKHIVAAGIRRVVYVEPYPKSKAGSLHGDAITVASSQPEPGKVRFEPFVGVAPPRYLELFDAQERARRGHMARKDRAGRVQTFDPRSAVPVFKDAEPEELRPALPAYRQRELIALDHYRSLRGLQERPDDGP